MHCIFPFSLWQRKYWVKWTLELQHLFTIFFSFFQQSFFNDSIVREVMKVDKINETRKTHFTWKSKFQFFYQSFFWVFWYKDVIRKWTQRLETFWYISYKVIFRISVLNRNKFCFWNLKKRFDEIFPHTSPMTKLKWQGERLKMWFEEKVY